MPKKKQDLVTKQMLNWEGAFGKEYSDRNPTTVKEIEKLYKKRYGITRTKMNLIFLNGLDKTIRILEVGANVGLQLIILKKMGFQNLCGIEINEHAIEISKKITYDQNLYICKGSIFDIPFKDEWFDLIFTSGVLIHINPWDIKLAIEEMYRCSKEWIWGFEYYSDNYVEIPYRGQENLLWKTDFVGVFLKYFPNINVVKRKKFKYLDNYELEDEMFLLNKGGKNEIL